MLFRSAAWMFAEAHRLPDFPGTAIAVGLYGLVVSVLALQPDFGQLMLITMVFGAIFFMAGLSWLWIGSLGAAALAGLVAAYMLMPHVASRIDRFVNPAGGDTYQIDRSEERRGGEGGRSRLSPHPSK